MKRKAPLVENFNTFLEKKGRDLPRFYFLADKATYGDGEGISAHTERIRKRLFDIRVITLDNFRDAEIEDGIPVINFCKDHLAIQLMLQERMFRKRLLFNHPEQSQLVSNKVSFHRLFEDSRSVPRTVFSVKDCEKLKFPIIAKPADGHSGMGIMKFEKLKDLRDSSESFDLFSEMIPIQKEYRAFCFRGKILDLNQRIRKKGSKDFMKKPGTQTSFFYESLDPLEYTHIDKLTSIVTECREKVSLDFYSIDFAETEDGKLFIIEMNSRTGMGGDKCVDLYREIHRVALGALEENQEMILGRMRERWRKEYENGEQLHECTLVAGKVDGKSFLFKNRDRSFTPENRVVHEVVEGNEIVYYTDQTHWIEGMNEHGVGVAFSMFTKEQHPGYEPSWLVTDEPKKVNDPDSPFKVKMRKLLMCKTAREAMNVLSKSDKEDNPGSFFVGDPQEIFDVEIFDGRIEARRVSKEIQVNTNHGEMIPDAGHQDTGDSIKRASSDIRRYQAELQLTGVKDISEIPSRMKQQVFDQGSSLNTFRTDDEEYTISQCMWNLTDRIFYFFHDGKTADTLTVTQKVENPKIRIVIEEI